jgi:competence protein CoiA
MQFFALDDDRSINAALAEKHRDYRCPECSRVIRLRSGPHRQPHFFHLEADSHCRQHQKSAEHLHVQLRLLSLFKGAVFMEKPFASIGRIADIAWETEKIVFEIQCSPISQEEVQARCRDYRSFGFEIVWVLHEKNFNKWRLSAAESSLREQTCYFTNISSKGKGIIYDQFDICQGSKRLFKGPPLPVFLDVPQCMNHTSEDSNLPLTLHVRSKGWALFFRGDLWDHWKRGLNPMQIAQRFQKLEEQILFSKSKRRFSVVSLITCSYSRLFNAILRKFTTYTGDA